MQQNSVTRMDLREVIGNFHRRDRLPTDLLKHLAALDTQVCVVSILCATFLQYMSRSFC